MGRRRGFYKKSKKVKKTFRINLNAHGSKKKRGSLAD
jgi:hypothetical protein